MIHEQSITTNEKIGSLQFGREKTQDIDKCEREHFVNRNTTMMNEIMCVCKIINVLPLENRAGSTKFNATHVGGMFSKK